MSVEERIAKLKALEVRALSNDSPASAHFEFLTACRAALPELLAIAEAAETYRKSYESKRPHHANCARRSDMACNCGLGLLCEALDTFAKGEKGTL